MNVQEDYSRNFFSRKRGVGELLHLKDDDSGYVEGKVFMTWPPRNGQHRISLEVAEESNLYRFEIEVPHKEGIAFRPHERVCIALKGVKVVQRKESSAPHYFPIVLRFLDGVVLKYSSGINVGQVVDTWEGDTDEWYNPGVVHTISDAAVIDKSEIRHAPVPSFSHRGQGADAPSILVPDGAATAQSIRLAEQPDTERPGRSSKMRQRKKRRLLKEKKRESAFPNQPIIENPPPTDATSRQKQTESSFDAPVMNVPGSHPRPHLIGGGTNGETLIPQEGGADGNNTVTLNGGASTSAPRLKAGIRTQRGDIYNSLFEIQPGPSMVNVIGVVAGVTPEKKTSSDAWHCSISLVDPSTVNSPRWGFTANCFQKKYPEWLPQVQKDDIVILRKLKIVEHHGAVSATGYGDKLRWAVYDPVEHSIRHPKRGNVPEKELIDHGMGYEYSPYWEPFQDSTEIEYCRQMGEWWKAMHAHKGEKVSVVQCSTARKEHRLISEASPDLPPDGWFSCTVEVLQKFSNSYGSISIYVTDYTVNTSLQPVQAPWCPPQLGGRVLRFNMWDDARDIANLMNPGEYWYLHNAQAKWYNQYIEGKVNRAEKVTQLDATKPEGKPYLKALLARKKEFQLNHPGTTLGPSPTHLFPEMLLQDVEETTSFLTCIVELLHIDINSRDGHVLYVTDYTYNPNLPTTISTAVWARNLEHRVVKIKLDDAQAKSSLDLTPGNVYIIRNMRIRYSSVSGGLFGCLGGDDTLIVPFRDSSGHQAHQLQRNKEKWERENMLNASTTMETEVVPKQSSVLLESAALQSTMEPAPGVIEVLARVMDFFPFSLEDACVLRCTNCNSCPLPSLKKCPSCDDMLESHCKWFYCLYVLLQDEAGDEFIVSLSGKECTLLQDIEPTDFRCDHVAFHKFLAKLDPILGNLRDVHLAWSGNTDKIIESPVMRFTLESWDIDDEKGYGLLNYAS